MWTEQRKRERHDGRTEDAWMSGLDNTTADMDPLDERRLETHMFCPDHRLLQDPGSGPKAEETPQDLVDSIRYKDVRALQVQVSRTTSEEPRTRKSQIDGMHSEVDKMEPNVTTTVKHNIFIRRDIWGYLASTYVQKQILYNNNRSMEEKLELTNKGTPVQQGSNRSTDKETKIGTLDTKTGYGIAQDRQKDTGRHP